MANEVNTRFRDQFKKTRVFASSELGRQKRAKDKLIDRRLSRRDEFSKQRNIVITEEPDAVLEVDARKLKLQKWKEEKKLKRQQAKKVEKPVFRAGVVHHRLGSPYLCVNSEEGRKTVRKTRNTPVSTVKSFAPPNFKFKAPVMNVPAPLPKERRAKAVNNVKNSATSHTVPNMGFENRTPQRMTRSRSKAALNNELVQPQQKISFVRKNINTKMKSEKPSAYVPPVATIEEEEEHMSEVQKTPQRSLEDPIPMEQASVESSCIPQEEQFPVHYSPYVTKARGKRSSARKSDDSIRTETTDAMKHGVLYFRSVIKSERERLESVCDEWLNIQQTVPHLPTEASDLINAAVGQTKLLLSKKFVTFQGLIDRCEKCEKNAPPVTCSDLEGFWDMMYMEVENIDCRFKKLEKMKETNWIEEATLTRKETQVAGGFKKQKKVQKNATSSLRALIAAARKKQQTETVTFANIRESLSATPVGTPVVKRTPSSVRHSRQSLLHQAIMGQRRESQGLGRQSSPIIMKVTQMAKNYINGSPNVEIQVTARLEYKTAVPDLTPRKSVQNPDLSDRLECKTPVTSQTPRKSILKRDQAREFEQTELEFKENVQSGYLRNSRRVRFEGTKFSDSPKPVQPVTPYVKNILSQSNSRQQNTRKSFVSDTDCDSPTYFAAPGCDLISFDSPEPRVLRRSSRLSSGYSK